MARIERPDHDPLTHKVIGCAIKIRKHLGVGLLENPYHQFLFRELQRSGLIVSSQPAISVEWDGLTVDLAYRPDLVVQNLLIVELKAVKELTEIDTAQILTYMRLSGIHTGLLINFHAMPFSKGIKRFSL